MGWWGDLDPVWADGQHPVGAGGERQVVGRSEHDAALAGQGPNSVFDGLAVGGVEQGEGGGEREEAGQVHGRSVGQARPQLKA